QPLATEWGAASDCADARKAAAAEYDAAFGDILEGIDYLTAKQEQVATVANAARTAAESDTAELISDVLRDMAKDRITDLMVKSVSTAFMGFFEEAGAATLSSIFGSGDALAIALAEEGVGVLAEAWDNIIGPAVAAAVIIAYETYLVVTDAQVPEKL